LVIDLFDLLEFREVVPPADCPQDVKVLFVQEGGV
jgi:hypothetical protein